MLRRQDGQPRGEGLAVLVAQGDRMVDGGGDLAGQRILARLAADIPAAVDAALALRDDDRQAFSPMLAVLSARHETQYSRLFRS